MPKKQFNGTARSRTFYDRKVLHYGYSRSLSLGKIIPKDWRYVRIRPIQLTSDKLVIEVTKLMGSEANASITPADKESKQYTPTARTVSRH